MGVVIVGVNSSLKIGIYFYFFVTLLLKVFLYTYVLLYPYQRQSQNVRFSAVNLPKVCLMGLVEFETANVLVF
jgi:hypothetical protein